MRTKLSQHHLCAILEGYFEAQGASINFLHFGESEDGTGIGVLVDHQGSIDMPVSENYPEEAR
jgi:hypothetical protein